MTADDSVPRTPADLSGISTYRAGILQSAVHRQLKKCTEDCLREYGISMMQWFVIGAIYDAGAKGISATQLSNTLGTNVPYITNALNKLAAKNIIIRGGSKTNDSRYKTVTLHPGYAATVRAIEAALRDKMRHTIYATITPLELRTYIGVLMKINHTLGKQG